MSEATVRRDRAAGDEAIERRDVVENADLAEGREMPSTRRLGDELAAMPKHHRVYLVLRQEILDGRHGLVAPMPGEVALAKEFGVSRITIRTAMDRLTQEGIVERMRGRGTFVRERGDSPIGASLSGNLENLMALGLRTDVRVVDVDYLPAPPAVAAEMDLPEGTTMQRAVRVRSLSGVPFSHLTTWLPEEIGRSFTPEELGREPLLKLIERTGRKVASARQVVTAMLAAPDVARHLKVEVGEALLSVRRTVHDGEGRPVERIFGLYRPDLYEHETSFSRNPDRSGGIWKA
ncbi:GntR family transcriptional regulator [Aurantimonas sp. 22II-16-19i]|uniref:GntR family transcriptional regulator n=1 Tax=Aurantimonas sp. 22II-16-19i TaxID=1317114 RepID=UPI0009F7B819|nr:GntR family transcriptional regulator [Aurantimonas sp. 22II-16-19i]ORE86724.1 GntR family transcriptional regulator [Aurantimonas sp. 22II-16-19i]